MNEDEKAVRNAHFDEFIEYIRKTDMHQGNQFIRMYNDLKQAQYAFRLQDHKRDSDMDNLQNQEQQESSEISLEIDKKRSINERNRQGTLFEVDENLKENETAQYLAYVEKRELERKEKGDNVD